MRNTLTLGDIGHLGQAAQSTPPLSSIPPPPIPNAPEFVQGVSKAISPWLWIFSVFGFGMAILNTRRIGRMYRTYRSGASIKLP